MLISNPQETKKVWAGKGKWFSAPRIRIWCIPTDDCIAWPTPEFYSNRYVFLSNEGSRLYEKWVALDRYNEEDWDNRKYTTHQLAKWISFLSEEQQKEISGFHSISYYFLSVGIP